MTFAPATIALMTNRNVKSNPNPNPYPDDNPYPILNQKQMLTITLTFTAGSIIAGAYIGLKPKYSISEFECIFINLLNNEAFSLQVSENNLKLP